MEKFKIIENGKSSLAELQAKYSNIAPQFVKVLDDAITNGDINVNIDGKVRGSDLFLTLKNYQRQIGKEIMKLLANCANCIHSFHNKRPI